jgi:hypothetical protein
VPLILQDLQLEDVSIGLGNQADVTLSAASVDLDRALTPVATGLPIGNDQILLEQAATRHRPRLAEQRDCS